MNIDEMRFRNLVVDLYYIAVHKLDSDELASLALAVFMLNTRIEQEYEYRGISASDFDVFNSAIKEQEDR